jgi:hypothetical protein
MQITTGTTLALYDELRPLHDLLIDVTRLFHSRSRQHDAAEISQSAAGTDDAPIERAVLLGPQSEDSPDGGSSIRGIRCVALPEKPMHCRASRCQPSRVPRAPLH